MARAEFIQLKLCERFSLRDRLIRSRLEGRSAAETISDVPQLYWQSGHPWHEVNLWFFNQAKLVSLGLRDIKTLHAIAVSMKFYMSFLESERLSWDVFPDKYAERCLVIFRGYLVKLRVDGELAPSTCKRRMNDVLKFYDWLLEMKMLDRKVLPFRKERNEIPIFNAAGLKER